MKKSSRIVPLILIIILTLACNFNSSLITGQLEPTLVIPTIAPAAAEPETEIAPAKAPPTEEAPTQPTVTSTADGTLDPCTLMTSEQAEGVLGEPVKAAKIMNGSCVFSNAKDELYMINIAAAQDKETSGILQGQAVLVMFSGNKVSEDFTNKMRALSDAQDFKGFFSELIAASKGSQTMTAKLFTGGGNDLVYWAWINAPPRRQGAFVAVRKNTMVNINVVLPDSADGGTLLKTLNNLAGDAFSKLPEKFSTVQATQTAASENPASTEMTFTPVPGTAVQVVQATPTLIPAGLTAPVLVSPKDGASFDIYPRTTTLTWQPVDGAARYLVEIMACSSSNTANCFSHPMIEQATRETTIPTYTFSFIGAQPGKWRVTPMDQNGVLGAPSAWWTFSYIK